VVKFAAKVQDGQIIIPDEYRADLANGAIVIVTLPDKPKVKFSDHPLIQELMQNPPTVQGSWKMTRDEIHER
jgi:hypothetical protein